ncbi:MAG: aldehyde dehydrogenase family protein, partial [Ilumatobacter sp.]|nr:aldehyde dehydrogenase family protein [Ilumatobacter sp.]
MKAFKNFINGEWVDAKSGETSAVIDPSTGEQYAEAALSGDADVDAAMAAASAAFEGWGNTTPSERALALI